MSDDALRSEFQRFDADGNGFIDEAEFSALVRALGASLSPNEVAVAFLAMDTNGNGRIEFGEFAGWWNKFRAKKG